MYEEENITPAFGPTLEDLKKLYASEARVDRLEECWDCGKSPEDCEC